MSLPRSSNNTSLVTNAILEIVQRRTSNHGRGFDGREKDPDFRRALGKSNPTPTVNFALPNHMRLNTQLLHASQRPRTIKRKKGRDKHTTITILAITITIVIYRNSIAL
jgi:hypothetical protein